MCKQRRPWHDCCVGAGLHAIWPPCSSWRRHAARRAAHMHVPYETDAHNVRAHRSTTSACMHAAVHFCWPQPAHRLAQWSWPAVATLPAPPPRRQRQGLRRRQPLMNRMRYTSSLSAEPWTSNVRKSELGRYSSMACVAHAHTGPGGGGVAGVVVVVALGLVTQGRACCLQGKQPAGTSRESTGYPRTVPALRPPPRCTVHREISLVRLPTTAPLAAVLIPPRLEDAHCHCRPLHPPRARPVCFLLTSSTGSGGPAAADAGVRFSGSSGHPQQCLTLPMPSLKRE